MFVVCAVALDVKGSARQVLYLRFRATVLYSKRLSYLFERLSYIPSDCLTYMSERLSYNPSDCLIRPSDCLAFRATVAYVPGGTSTLTLMFVVCAVALDVKRSARQVFYLRFGATVLHVRATVLYVRAPVLYSGRPSHMSDRLSYIPGDCLKCPSDCLIFRAIVLYMPGGPRTFTLMFVVCAVALDVKGSARQVLFRGTLLIINTPLLGPYVRTLPEVIWWS